MWGSWGLGSPSHTACGTPTPLVWQGILGAAQPPQASGHDPTPQKEGPTSQVPAGPDPTLACWGCGVGEGHQTSSTFQVGSRSPWRQEVSGRKTGACSPTGQGWTRHSQAGVHGSQLAAAHRLGFARSHTVCKLDERLAGRGCQFQGSSVSLIGASRGARWGRAGRRQGWMRTPSPPSSVPACGLLSAACTPLIS